MTHDHIKWWGRIDGTSGLIPFLFKCYVYSDNGPGFNRGGGELNSFPGVPKHQLRSPPILQSGEHWPSLFILLFISLPAPPSPSEMIATPPRLSVNFPWIGGLGLINLSPLTPGQWVSRLCSPLPIHWTGGAPPLPPTCNSIPHCWAFGTPTLLGPARVCVCVCDP